VSFLILFTARTRIIKFVLAESPVTFNEVSELKGHYSRQQMMVVYLKYNFTVISSRSIPPPIGDIVNLNLTNPFCNAGDEEEL